MKDVILPGLSVKRILARYATSSGNEIDSGKFESAESSAALAANTFGLFLDRAADLPPLPNCDGLGWPANYLDLEVTLRLPWARGSHPCLDVLVRTSRAVIGIESKRYEPFRTNHEAALSDAYWRPVWGTAMSGCQRVRDNLRDDSKLFARLDAAQLVKHALGLRTAIHKGERTLGKRPVLFYLYAEPTSWPDGRQIDRSDISAHRAEIARFATSVDGDEVTFISASYQDLLGAWSSGPNEGDREHAAAVRERFAP